MDPLSSISSIAASGLHAQGEQVATLDRLSGGRFILGVGLGAYREEFTALSPRLKKARRGDMLDEAFIDLATE